MQDPYDQLAQFANTGQVTTEGWQASAVDDDPYDTLARAWSSETPRGFTDALSEWSPLKMIPGVGAAIEASEEKERFERLARVATGKASKEDLDQAAYDARPTTKFGYTAGKAGTSALEFAPEFAAASLLGGAAGGAAAVAGAGKKVQTAAKVAGFVGGLGATQEALPQVFGDGGRMTAAAYRRALNGAGTQITENEAGDIELAFGASLGDFESAWPKGILDVVIEDASELSGGLINKVSGLGALQSAVANWFVGKHGGTVVDFGRRMAQRGAWAGPVSEYLEEAVGEAARAGTRWLPEGVQLQAPGDAVEIFPGAIESLGMLTAFAMFPAAVGAVQIATDKLLAPKPGAKEEIAPEPSATPEATQEVEPTPSPEPSISDLSTTGASASAEDEGDSGPERALPQRWSETEAVKSARKMGGDITLGDYVKRLGGIDLRGLSKKNEAGDFWSRLQRKEQGKSGYPAGMLYGPESKARARGMPPEMMVQRLQEAGFQIEGTDDLLGALESELSDSPTLHPEMQTAVWEELELARQEELDRYYEELEAEREAEDATLEGEPDGFPWEENGVPDIHPEGQLLVGGKSYAEVQPETPQAKRKVLSARRFGTRLRIADTEDFGGVSVTPGEIIVSKRVAESPTFGREIVYHEVLHDISRRVGGLDGLYARVRKVDAQGLRRASRRKRLRLRNENGAALEAALDAPRSIRREETLATRTEELVAYLELLGSEQGKQHIARIVRSDRGLLEKILDALRRIGARVFGGDARTRYERDLAELTEALRVIDPDSPEATATNAKVAQLIREALEAGARAEAGDTAGLDPRFADVWHGTGADLKPGDKFLNEKIGSGEGAQAYGWGHYFASARKIAEWYKKKLSRRRDPQLFLPSGESFGDRKLAVDDMRHWAAKRIVDEHLDNQVPIDEMARRLIRRSEEMARFLTQEGAVPSADVDIDYATWKTYRDATLANQETVIAFAQEVLDNLDGVRVDFPGGALLQVTLAPAEDEYLLWDEPLSAQSEKVRGALGKVKAHREVDGWFTASARVRGKVVPVQRRVIPGGVAEVAEFEDGGRPLFVAVVNGEEIGTYSTSFEAQKVVDIRFPDMGRTGEQLYRTVQDHYDAPVNAGQTQRLASEALLAAGIRGIKYLDGSSRSKGEGAYNYVVFDPADAKIEARFAPAPPDSASSAPPFFSAIERGIEGLKQNRFTSGQLDGMVKKIPGVTEEEMAWIDWKELLAGRKNVTKEEALEWVRAHRVEVREKVLGDIDPSFKFNGEILEVQDPDKGWPSPDMWMGDVERMAPDDVSPAEWIEAVREVAGESLGGGTTPVVFGDEGQYTLIPVPVAPTRHPDYQLPGGENYRELLLVLPGVDYTGGHYGDTPGVLAHIRFTERTDAEGRRVLFIEEIQSDIHQEGRKKGYSDPERDAERLAAAQKELSEAEQAYDKWFRSIGTKAAAEMRLSEIQARPEARRVSDARAAVSSLMGKDAVPDAPFKSSWPTLALKRAIKWAADNGFDAVSWTTGVQQVERYETAFRQAVDEISWNGRDVTVWKNGSAVVGFTVDGNGVVEEGGARGGSGELAGKPLEDLVGKSIAERILSENSGRIAEEGLTIGGKGMSDFYDKILVNAANKLGKRFGVKVGRGWLSNASGRGQVLYSPAEGLYLVEDAAGDVLGRFDTHAEAAAFVGGDTAPVHTLPLTDDMRATVRGQGFSTFAPRFAPAPPTDSEAFRRWFGDSKVVDAEGKPLVVYHGTPYPGFDEFEARDGRFQPSVEGAFYFAGNPDLAERFSSDWQFGERMDDRSGILPVYLSAQNPRILEREIRPEDVKAARAAGHDGLIGANALGFPRHRGPEYVVFTPTQIKSATGNRGTYDAGNPDIRYAPGDERVPRKTTDAQLEQFHGLRKGAEAGTVKGRPDLAQTGEAAGAEVQAVQTAVDEMRNMRDIPRARDLMAAQRTAKRNVDANAGGVEHALLRDIRQGKTPTPEDVFAMRELGNRTASLALRTGDELAWRKAMVLNWAYRQQGSDQSAAFRARQQKYNSDVRGEELVALILARPTYKTDKELSRLLRKRNKSTTTDAEKKNIDADVERLLDAEAKRTKKVYDALRRHGYDPALITKYDWQDPYEATRLIRIIGPARASVHDKAREFLYASMLSHPYTQMRNITGNAINVGLSKHTQEVVEALVNLAVKDPDSPQLAEARFIFTEFAGAMQEAGRRFVRAYRVEAMADAMSEQDAGRVAQEGLRGPAISRDSLLGKAFLPLRWISLDALRAFDEAFKGYIGHIAVRQFAYREAKAEGITNPETLSRRMDQLIMDPAIQERVREQELELTFQEKADPQSLTGILERTAMDLRAYGDRALPFFGTLQFPFVKTALRILRETIRRTPIGPAVGLTGIGKDLLFRRVVGKRRIVRVGADTAISALLFWAVISLLDEEDEDGLPIIGGTNADWQDRAATGVQRSTSPAYTLKVGGRLLNFKQRDPVGGAIALTVDFANGLKAGGAKGAAGALGSGIGRNVLDQSYMEAASDLEQLVRGHKDLAGWFYDKYATPWVPNIIKGTLRESDSTIRERRTEEWLGTGEGAPILRRMAYNLTNAEMFAPPPKVDVWGREVKRTPTGLLNGWLLERNISSGEAMKGDILLYRWSRKVASGEAGHDDARAWYPSLPNTSYKQDGRTHHYTEAQYETLTKLGGQYFAEAVESARLNVDDPTEEDIKSMQRLREKAYAKAKKVALED